MDIVTWIPSPTDAPLRSRRFSLPTSRSFDVPKSARFLLDELTLWGAHPQARSGLDHLYAAGANYVAIAHSRLGSAS